jgi:TrpR-related protein YerC/YecD
MTPKEDKLQQLYELLASVSDPKDIEHLLEDLCTKKEVENMAERIFAAKLLIEGKTYNQVMEKTSISSATLSRVSQCVQYGKGYSKLLR